MHDSGFNLSFNAGSKHGSRDGKLKKKKVCIISRSRFLGVYLGIVVIYGSKR